MGGERGETERKRRLYHRRSRSAVKVGDVHAASLGTAPALTGSWTQGEGGSGRRSRALDAAVARITAVGGGRGWTLGHWDKADRELVRGTGR